MKNADKLKVIVLLARHQKT